MHRLYILLRFHWEEMCVVCRFLQNEWQEASEGWSWLLGVSVFYCHLEWMFENDVILTERFYREIRKRMLQKKICRAAEIPTIAAM
jgi:hypothetical protein